MGPCLSAEMPEMLISSLVTKTLVSAPLAFTAAAPDLAPWDTFVSLPGTLPLSCLSSSGLLFVLIVVAGDFVLLDVMVL